MQEVLEINEFLSLSQENSERYILDTMNLEDFWVMGYISNPKDEEKSFFFIEKLINPYTADTLNLNVFKQVTVFQNIYCPLPKGKERFNNGSLVAAKVRINDPSKIKEGKILKTNFNDVYCIEDKDILSNLLDKLELKLPIIAITKPTVYSRSQFEIDKLTNIIQEELQRERRSIEDYTNKEKEKIANQFEELRIEKEKLNKAAEDLKNNEQILVENSIVLNEKVELLEKLGFSLKPTVFNKESKGLQTFDLPDKKSELIKLIQEQLALRGYYYESHFLRQLLMSLTTGQMIILMGPSGTGKTTIIKQLADVIDANYEIIPVQPSWTDKQDLIGFYNPIRKLFVPTPFLDCLIKAKNNPNKLFFICLDEMNLAQIEYYLADILSIREIPGEKLRLYSDFEYEQNISEIRWFIQHVLKSNQSIEESIFDENIETMTHFEMASRYTNMQRYLPQLEIPSNIRIIGTMNVDGAVQAISPKIVDRSFIIPVIKQNKKENVDSQKTIGCYPLHPDMFLLESAKNISPTLRSGLNKIQQELDRLNIFYNDRVEKHMQQYYNASHDFEIKTKQQLDDLVVMKLFPRIHDTFEETQLEGLRAKIEEELDEDSQAFKKLKHMQARMKETSLLSYWS